jgi:hypothetical protein
LLERAAVDDKVLAALIGTGGALLGVLLTILSSWLIGRRARARERREALTLTLARDLLTMRQLEGLYLDHLAEVQEGSPDSIKRRIWDEYEINGGERPSRQAEPARLKRLLEDLDP